jgi:hypothetical protein
MSVTGLHVKRFNWMILDDPIRLECRWRELLAVVEPIMVISAGAAYVNRKWCVYRLGVLLGSSRATGSESARLAAEAFMHEHYNVAWSSRAVLISRNARSSGPC